MAKVRIQYALLTVLNRLPSVALTFIDSEAQVCHQGNQGQGIGN
jgi:hypothetical protein